MYFEKDFSFWVPDQICRRESKCLMAMNAALLRTVFTEAAAGVVGSRPFKNAVARPRHVAVPPSLACKFPKCRKRQRRMNTLSLRPPPPPSAFLPCAALDTRRIFGKGKNLPLSLSLSPSRSAPPSATTTNDDLNCPPKLPSESSPFAGRAKNGESRRERTSRRCDRTLKALDLIFSQSRGGYT